MAVTLAKLYKSIIEPTHAAILIFLNRTVDLPFMGTEPSNQDCGQENVTSNKHF